MLVRESSLDWLYSIKTAGFPACPVMQMKLEDYVSFYNKHQSEIILNIYGSTFHFSCIFYFLSIFVGYVGTNSNSIGVLQEIKWNLIYQKSHPLSLG